MAYLGGSVLNVCDSHRAVVLLVIWMDQKVQLKATKRRVENRNSDGYVGLLIGKTCALRVSTMSRQTGPHGRGRSSRWMDRGTKLSKDRAR